MAKQGNARYKLLIVSATIIWGLSFIVMKDAVDDIGPFLIVGIRFLVCGLGLAAVFWRKMKVAFNRDTITKGIILGIMLFLAYIAQTFGLTDTTPGKNAFLTATYCVMVPFFWWVIGHRAPRIGNLAAAFLCIIGIFLVAVSGDLTVGFGDSATLLSAAFFGIHIAFVSKWVEGRDVYVLTVYQFIAMGVLGFAGSFAFEPMPTAAISFELVVQLMYLTVFASALALLFQNIGLAHVPPSQASLLLSLESVFGVFFSVVFYGEQLTVRLVVGFALIFAAILISELKGSSEADQKKVEQLDGKGVLLQEGLEGCQDGALEEVGAGELAREQE